MTRYEKSMNLTDSNFKQIIGVSKASFSEMLCLLTSKYAEKHQKGGSPSKLSLADQLFLSIKYWRQYVTQKELAFEFEIGQQHMTSLYPKFYIVVIIYMLNIL